MIYLCGTKDNGQAFSNILKKYTNCKDIIAFYDVDNNKEEPEIEGAPVVDYTIINKKENEIFESIFIITVGDTDKQKYVKHLNEIGINKNIYYIDEMDQCLDNIEHFIGKPILPYIETHLSDHCNLNCKGCGHLSNIAPEKFADYEKFSNDMYRLKELFSGIKKIRLMGGEPFLNPHLLQFVELAKKEYRDTDIRIVTNGLFFGIERDKTLKRLADLDIRLDISGYPPTIKRKNEIKDLLDQYEIQYHFTEKVDNFFRFRNPKADIKIKTAFEHCKINMCTFLREGKMAPCSFPILYTQLDTIMKEKFQISSNDIIDIYDAGINGWKIVWKLTHPIYSCKYCKTNELEFYPWEQAPKNIASCNDWFVEE